MSTTMAARRALAVLLPLALACSGQKPKPEPSAHPPGSPAFTCAPGRGDLNEVVPGKLAGDLDTAFQMWRVTGRNSDSVVVDVAYTGEIAPLREAGLEVIYDRGESVDGRICFRDLPRLTAVASVSYVEMQPRVHPC